jgi:hypothetical protein
MKRSSDLQRIREQIEQAKQRVFEIAEQLEEQEIYERLKPEQRETLDAMLRGYQRDYGAVSYQYWLRAVVRSMRGNIKGLHQMLVHELLPRTATDAKKIKYLQVMARQMRVDVKIEKNMTAKAPAARKKVSPIKPTLQHGV